MEVLLNLRRCKLIKRYEKTGPISDFDFDDARFDQLRTFQKKLSLSYLRQGAYQGYRAKETVLRNII